MNTRQGAREILAHLEAIYVPRHDYVSVRANDYSHLDLKFYERVRSELESQGFVHLADCEDRTIAAAPGNVLMPAMVRVMASADGVITAAVYHARIKPLWLRLLSFATGKQPGRIVDLETEFEDGSFVCTTTAVGASAISLPSLVRVEFLPRNTSVTRLLERHRERVAEKRAQSALAARCIATLAEVWTSQNRMNAIKSAFRGEIGGITREELEKLARGRHTLARDVHAEIQTIHAERAADEAVMNSTAEELPVRGSSADAPKTTPDDVLLAELEARGEKAGSGGSSSTTLLVTAVLFVALGGFHWGWQTVVFLAVAVALHEFGHVLAMRVFGYKNVRMLFLPFFGGLATGEPRELDATKNAIVALAGPAFGIATVAAAAIAALFANAPLWLVNFAWVSLFLNAFNLLPLVPFDGGQFTNDTLFSRYPVLELIFRLLAIAGLGLIAWAWNAWLLGGVAVFMLMTTQVVFRRACLIRDARRDPIWQTRALDREAVVVLRGIVTKIFKGVPKEKYQSKLPEHVHGVWLEIRKRFPGPGRTVALLASYLALCFIIVPVIAVFLAKFLPHPAY